MACRGNLLEDFRMPNGMLAYGEEHGPGALFCQRPEYGWRIIGPWTVIEGEHYFSVAQEIVGFEVLESKTRSSSAVDFNNSGDAERTRIARTCSGVRCLCKCP